MDKTRIALAVVKREFYRSTLSAARNEVFSVSVKRPSPETTEYFDTLYYSRKNETVFKSLDSINALILKTREYLAFARKSEELVDYYQRLNFYCIKVDNALSFYLNVITGNEDGIFVPNFRKAIQDNIDLHYTTFEEKIKEHLYRVMRPCFVFCMRDDQIDC